MSSTFQSVQMDANGNFVEPNSTPAASTTAFDEITVTDVNALNARYKVEAAEQRAAQRERAQANNWDAEIRRLTAETDTFTERANEAAEKSNAAFAAGDHANARHYAEEYARLSRIADRQFGIICDRTALNGRLASSQAGVSKSAQDKLQAELNKQVSDGVWDEPAY